MITLPKEAKATPEGAANKLKVESVSAAITALMKSGGVTSGQMTEMLGMKGTSGVSQALNRDMKTSMALRFLSALGAELIVRSGEVEYVISPESR